MCVANTGPVSLAVHCYIATSPGLQQCAGWLAFLGKGRWGCAGCPCTVPCEHRGAGGIGRLGRDILPPLWDTRATARGAEHSGLALGALEGSPGMRPQGRLGYREGGGSSCLVFVILMTSS